MTFSATEWLTAREAAERLSISREWVRQLIHEGRLRAEQTRLGYLIDVASIEAYAADRATEHDRRTAEQIRRGMLLLQGSGISPASLPAEGGHTSLHWQRETGLTDPDAVVAWLAEGDERVNGGRSLPTNSTHLIRADRKGRHGGDDER